MEPTNPTTPTTNLPDLTTVAVDVLGDLAFMVTDDELLELPTGTVWMQGEVSYFGPVEGTVSCWCTRDFAVRLAANLLGIEPEEGEAQVNAEDSVREFMNVLCGQLVTLWHGTQDVYNLSIPKVTECLETPTVPDTDPRHRSQLSIDGEPLLFAYRPGA
jgi:chemotaxis protein CheY-P-specific phosphatase CheC